MKIVVNLKFLDIIQSWFEKTNQLIKQQGELCEQEEPKNNPLTTRIKTDSDRLTSVDAYNFTQNIVLSKTISPTGAHNPIVKCETIPPTGRENESLICS